MLTIMIHATIKKEKLDEFLEMAALLTTQTRNKRQGCHAYSFNQRSDQPLEFVLYEQWETQAHLDAHIEQLVLLLGPAKPGQLLPEKLIDMYASAEPVFYNPVL